MTLLKMSSSAGILVLVVVLIRALLMNRIPKKTFVLLWSVVVLRSLLPFSIQSPFSIYTLLGAFGHNPVQTAGNSVTVITRFNGATQASVDVAKRANGDLGILALWATGLVICALFFAISYWVCIRKFQTSTPIHNDTVSQWLSTHTLSRKIEVRQSDRITTPLTYGILRPVILLPKKMEWGNHEQLQYVLLHEYIHIRRFDSITKLVLTATLCVHWFNPLVWVMYVLANRDIEISCDEAVVRTFGETVKSAYARALIGMEEKKTGFMPMCSSFSKNAIEERIIAIMKIKKSSIVGIIAAITLVAGTTTVFATSAVAATTQAQQAILADQNDDVVSKGSALVEPKESDLLGVYSKIDGSKISGESDGIPTLQALRVGDYYGEPIEKGSTENVIPSDNVIYFNSEADRDNHLRALEANAAKGINRYTGFESMYVGIDTNEPITYLVGENLIQFDNSGTIKKLASYPFFQPTMQD